MEKKSPFFRIDESVFITMAVVSIVSIMVLAFRFKTNEPCQAIKILVNTSAFREGSPIQFKAEVENGKIYEWDFGDNSIRENNSSSAVHIYKKAGKYTVAVTVNNRCTEVQQVYIKEAPRMFNIDLLPKFISPDTALVNKPVTLKDITTDATSWEWRFGESDAVDATSKEPVYIYKTSGIKTVYLKINDRSDRVATRMIYVKGIEAKKENNNTPVSKPSVKFKMPRVKDKPESPPIEKITHMDLPEEPKLKAPEISNEQMGEGLEGIISGEKSAEDFLKYLCGDVNVMVVYNGEAMTFLQMCNELTQFKKLKKLQEPKVLLIVDGLTGCIKTMNVTIKKKSLIKRIF